MMFLKSTAAFCTSKYLNSLRIHPTRSLVSAGCNTPENTTNQRPIEPAKVRMGFIPDDWFTFFYNKTGVTGPYMFGVGLLNYLFSKEIYICEHEFYNGLSMALLCIAAVKKLGPLVADYCDKEIDKIEQKWQQMHKEELKALESLIEHERQEQWRAEGSLLLMQMKKENIALQLEEAHRKAMMKVYEDVKHRLDYQVDCRNIEIRINHKHMVNWVVNKVLAEAPLPDADDEAAREKYRADLSAMALRIK
ncbi:ATP synthase subunit b, mitochondrial-like [Musca domestica]|uniref:ATP synthase subunit b n=1 Tax=Musca domestica TaxID=7370 RepID=A0A1I8M1P5_MUSDO|nr:ATP synthase subunit b, mitochondrial-like [Musca domestica]